MSGYLSAKRYWRGPKSQEVGERGRRVERQVSQPSRLTGRQKPIIYQSIRRGTDWDRNPVRLGRDGVLLTGVCRGAIVDILVDIFRVCHLRLSSVARTRSGKMLDLTQLPGTAGEHIARLSWTAGEHTARLSWTAGEDGQTVDRVGKTKEAVKKKRLDSCGGN